MITFNLTVSVLRRRGGYNSTLNLLVFMMSVEFNITVGALHCLQNKQTGDVFKFLQIHVSLSVDFRLRGKQTSTGN